MPYADILPLASAREDTEGISIGTHVENLNRERFLAFLHELPHEQLPKGVGEINLSSAVHIAENLLIHIQPVRLFQFPAGYLCRHELFDAHRPHLLEVCAAISNERQKKAADPNNQDRIHCSVSPTKSDLLKYTCALYKIRPCLLFVQQQAR